MKVLVVGSGAREHALVWKLAQSPLKPEIFCAPGNAGTRELATNVEVKAETPGALAVWAVNNKIDLTVVGPEAPLAAGLVDIFSEHGLKAFGPSKAAAQLEASKSFSKEVMLKAGVCTAPGQVFTNFNQAKDYVIAQGAPIVIKADGLAAGKGVVVARRLEDALQALDDFMLQERLGGAGTRVIVEKCLEGQEASVIAMVDGTTVLPLVVSQDYKRINDGDQGPNTGGMGAISPTPVLSDQRVENLIGEIFIPTLKELRSRGITYVGFLYAGVLVEKSGAVNVIEFNCRLGDPETQVIMMRMKSDLLPVIEAALNGNLSSVELKWRSEAAACVVLSSRGYPGTPDDGKLISGLFPGSADLQIFHAGTKVSSNNHQEVISKGGRILTVTALGSTLNAALSRAYEGVKKISFDGMHCRRDIGGGAW